MGDLNSGPLKGIRVLELTTGGPGPQLGKVLADFGAEVMKIESPEPRGGMSSSLGDRRAKSTLHSETNRNKKGLTLDLKDPRGVQIFKGLVAISDVVVENFSSLVMTRLGLDYPVLKEINPTLVMIRMSGLGHHGPKSHYVTWGPNLLPFMGKTHLWNHPDAQRPVGSQHPHPDFFAGTVGATLTVSALYHRSLTGMGQYFDCAQVEMAAPLIGPSYLDYEVNKRIPKPKGNTSRYMAPHGIYRCKGDDQWVAIAVRDERDWSGFKKALGSPAWAQSRRFSTASSRVEHALELDRLVEEWTIERGPIEAVQVLQQSGVPAGEVHAAPGLKDDEQLNARGFWTPTESPFLGTLLYAGEPIHLSEAPFRLRRRAPLIGEHNGEIIGELLGLEPPL